MSFCFDPAAQTGRISSPAPTPLAKLRWVYAGLGLMKCKPRLMLIAATYISLYWALQLSLESRAPRRESDGIGAGTFRLRPKQDVLQTSPGVCRYYS